MKLYSVILLIALCVSACVATVYNIKTTDNHVTILKSLVAGDTANFQAGTHVVSGKAAFIFSGTVAAPITITGVAGTIVKRNDASNNIWDFNGFNFILKNIEFTGGSRGLRLGEQGNCGNVLLQDLKVHDTQDTAVSFNDATRDYNNITIRRVEVYNTGADTGECFYTGCNDNNCQFRNSLIDNIYCHDTLSALDGYGSGVNMKSGSYGNTIRNSVFWNVKGPGVFFYDNYDNALNIGEGNLIVNNGDNGIQVTAGAIIRNNIVINSAGSGIAGATNQLMSGKLPRNITIIHNTVSGSINDYCLRGNSWGAASITVANNVFFCESAAGGAFKINGDQSTAKWFKNGFIGLNDGAPASGVFAVSAIATELIAPASYNFYPQSTSKLRNAANTGYTTATDFNCNARINANATVGAYQYSSATNPGWAITKATKPACPSGGTTTASATTAATVGTSTTGTTTGGSGVSPNVQFSWTITKATALSYNVLATNISNVLAITSTRVDTVSINTVYSSLIATAVFRIKDEGSNLGSTQATNFINLVKAKDAKLAANGFVNANIPVSTGGTPNEPVDETTTDGSQVSAAASWVPMWMAATLAVFFAL